MNKYWGNGCPICKVVLAKAKKTEGCVVHCELCDTYWSFDENGTARIKREINSPTEVVFNYPYPT